MRDSLKSMAGWLGLLAFLALPNCFLDRGGIVHEPEFNPGAGDLTGAIFCDIENVFFARHCADPSEIANGVPLAHRGVALVTGQNDMVGLDYSPAAIAAADCAPGQPVAVTFHGPFPDGTPACINCGDVIPSVYADVNAACAVLCVDLNLGAGPEGFCDDPAHQWIRKSWQGQGVDPRFPLTTARGGRK